jgi:hypothetical protein
MFLSSTVSKRRSFAHFFPFYSYPDFCLCNYLLCTSSIRCIVDREHSKQDVRPTAMDDAECLVTATQKASGMRHANLAGSRCKNFWFRFDQNVRIPGALTGELLSCEPGECPVTKTRNTYVHTTLSVWSSVCMVIRPYGHARGLGEN